MLHFASQSELVICLLTGKPTIISKYGKEVFEIFDNYIRFTIPFNTEVLENHGALSGVNNIELNELESKVYEVIKIN